MKTSQPLTIGQVARQAGVGVETIRFYERQGLLKPPARRASGYRQYGPDAVEILRFTRRAKGLGFTLREIKGLLDLRINAAATRDEVRERAAAKIAEVEAKIADLQRIGDALRGLMRQCHGHGPATNCPILQAFQQAETSEET